jgi:methionine--tRNA ligase beta chain
MADAVAEPEAEPEASGPSVGEQARTSFGLLDVRVGEILEAWPHPESEKLWCERIDVGEKDEDGNVAPREIASGLRAYYKDAGDLTGRKVLVVCNLKAAKLAGFSSNGMVLCASSEDKETVAFVEPPEGAAPGARVGLAEVEPMAPAGANAVKKKKHMEKAAAGLRTADTVATCDGVPLSVEGSPCVSPSVPAGTIS